MRTRISNILTGAVSLFLLLGAIGWFAPFLGRPFRSWIELPNTEPHGIVLDGNGNIYCGSKGYGRIQKYNPDGKFLRGFDTHGGFWRGTDFGFYFNDKGNLCILVSGLARSHRDSFYRLTVYDSKGNVLKTEKYTKPGTDYFYPFKNQVADSAGNIYVFKGFLFPRVVKQTLGGDRAVIISTPVWLWFFQAPFPAFAFFFVSMFIIIFLGFKATAAELSIPIINLIVNREKLPSRRKFIFVVLGIIGIVILLSIIIPIGLKTYPLLVIFGFVSFAITLAIIMLLAFICLVLTQWRCIKVDFKLWKNSIFASSLKTRYEAGRSLRPLMDQDPITQKTGKVSTKIVLLCLLVWFVILVLAICVVLYLDHIGVLHDLINKV